ncbi:hypothetical protein QA649_35495 [Bradyrhizobium sp. CB1717]|uniref:hypothetical protein n=1 Tax=Bradyrhizobium sp. CB1717 TaxID=3039154 RepID=UPI0024B091E7|nr:hypothetical protein [Bradyrhizobium sp. CB1717]WFU23311.1 hypothetical protein QA649_35495 [Bradyrhizobium sp. CB1717]
MLRHKHSANDDLILQMSLTAKTRKHLATLAPRQAAQDELTFNESGIDRSSEFIAKAATVRHRLEWAGSGIQKTKRTLLSEMELANHESPILRIFLEAARSKVVVVRSQRRRRAGDDGFRT